MIKEENLKIITLCFVVLAFLSAWTMRVVLESLAVYSGLAAHAYGLEWFRHGLPIAAGLGVFLRLQLNHATRVWAQEVIVEVRKVVWPSQKATASMTAMVCVILLVSGAVLGLFDLAGGVLVDFIIN